MTVYLRSYSVKLFLLSVTVLQECTAVSVQQYLYHHCFASEGHISSPNRFSFTLAFKPYFDIRVKLIFEAFHTYMLIWPHTFVAQQHASPWSIFQGALRTDKGPTASSPGFTYHFLSNKGTVWLSVHISILLISTDWTLKSSARRSLHAAFW